MADFGQVVEAYSFRGQNWLTIWDFRQERKFSIACTPATALTESMLVSYDRAQAGEMRIAAVDVDELPPGTVPVMEPTFFAAVPLPPFLTS